MPTPETVLVTGASSGIGQALAHRFARDGSTCVLLARSEDALHDLADTLKSMHGVDALVLPADLSVPGAAGEIVAELQARGLTIDVLVNNAGFGARGRFAELDTQRQTNMIRVNVTALTELTRRLLPDMLSRNRGGVLNVASTATFQPGPYMSVYYATKAYVLSFSEGLAGEIADTDVTVTCLAPGPTDTAFMERADMHVTTLFETASTMCGPSGARRLPRRPDARRARLAQQDWRVSGAPYAATCAPSCRRLAQQLTGQSLPPTTRAVAVAAMG